MSEASKMPARIAVANSGLCQWDLPGEYVSPNTEYIRADIAEQMAEALERLLEVHDALGAGQSPAAKAARAVLSAWEASNPAILKARQASNEGARK